MLPVGQGLTPSDSKEFKDKKKPKLTHCIGLNKRISLLTPRVEAGYSLNQETWLVYFPPSWHNWKNITTVIKLYHWLKNVATGKTRPPVVVNSQAGDVLWDILFLSVVLHSLNFHLPLVFLRHPLYTKSGGKMARSEVFFMESSANRNNLN